MGTTTQAAENTTVQPRERADASLRQAEHNVANTVGNDNGRTAIGTGAADVGRAAGEAGARTMQQLGLDNVTIGAAKGIKEQLGEEMKEAGKGLGDKIGDGTHSQLQELLKQTHEPTKEERADAQKKLDDQISKLLKPEDQKALGDLQTAIVNGDHEAFGKAIAGLAGDPARRDAMVKELNKNLENSGSDTRAVVDSKGNVILHNGGDTAVVFDKEGKASVREISHRPDGSIVLGGEVVGGKSSVAGTMKGLGNDTVNDISGPQFGGVDKLPMPFPLPSPLPKWPDKFPTDDWWKKRDYDILERKLKSTDR
jgi:hypothetical protein